MERLQKVMAQAGIASRRKSEEYILEGRVKVNGVVVTELGTKVSEDDYILVDEKPIRQERKMLDFYDKKRTIQWLASRGLQLPKLSNNDSSFNYIICLKNKKRNK